jgi:hypothetical protein
MKPYTPHSHRLSHAEIDEIDETVEVPLGIVIGLDAAASVLGMMAASSCTIMVFMYACRLWGASIQMEMLGVATMALFFSLGCLALEKLAHTLGFLLVNAFLIASVGMISIPAIYYLFAKHSPYLILIPLPLSFALGVEKQGWENRETKFYFWHWLAFLIGTPLALELPRRFGFFVGISICSSLIAVSATVATFHRIKHKFFGIVGSLLSVAFVIACFYAESLRHWLELYFFNIQSQ